MTLTEDEMRQEEFVDRAKQLTSQVEKAARAGDMPVHKVLPCMWLLALPNDILDRIDIFLNLRSSASFSIYRHDMIRYGEIRPYDAWFLEE